MKTKLLLWALFAGVLILSCNEDDDGGREPVFTPQGYLKVWNQIYDDGLVTIDFIQLNHDGWVAIYRYTDQREELLGYTFLESGTHEDVSVDLGEFPALENGDTLMAVLHLDVNENEEFDWDGQSGIDLPLQRGYWVVSQQFKITINGASWITVEDQAIIDNKINIANVDLEKVNEEWFEGETLWLVAHNEPDYGPGDVVGLSQVLTIGSHNNVMINFDQPIGVGETIWLVLYNDAGIIGNFEIGIDKPLWDSEKEDLLMTSITIID